MKINCFYGGMGILFLILLSAFSAFAVTDAPLDIILDTQGIERFELWGNGLYYWQSGGTCPGV